LESRSEEIRSMAYEIHLRILKSLEQAELDTALLMGSDNLSYVGGVILPFPKQYSDRRAALILTVEGEKCLIVPSRWEEAVRDQGWDAQIVTYEAGRRYPLSGLIGVLKKVEHLLMDRSVGLDSRNVSAATLEQLREHLDGVRWVAIDQIINNLRMKKTPDEVDKLRKAALHADRGLIGAINHLEGTVDGPGYTLAEFAERVRVHIIEFGGTGIGNLCVMQGEGGLQHFAPTVGRFNVGNLARVDYTNHYQGYWSNSGRTIVIGEATDEQRRSYRENQRLKQVAADELRSGVLATDLFEVVAREAESRDIEWWAEAGVGHGVGRSEIEPPYITKGASTVLRAGMVIAVDVRTLGPKGELVHSKDLYEITEHGSTKLNWYRDWDELYEVRGFRAAH
jgi:Xaa-Pro aminopeptidase